MVKTKRVRNGKMKKHNKTQKYVKIGGFLSGLRRKNKKPNLPLINPKDFKGRLEVQLYPIINKLNGISQDNELLNEELDKLFKHLTQNMFDINKINIGDKNKDWCSLHRDNTLIEYIEFKEMLERIKLEKPSLDSLIKRIQERINEFETEHPEYKDGFCISKRPNTYESVRRSSSDDSLPSLPPPPPPPRRKSSRKKSGLYAKLGPGVPGTKRYPSRISGEYNMLIKNDPYAAPVDIREIQARKENELYETVVPPGEGLSTLRKKKPELNYNPFTDY